MLQLSASNPFSPDAAPPLEGDFARLFSLSLDLLCVAGLDGYLKRVNPSWTRVLGWSESELLSRPVVHFMHPDDRERTLQARAGLARGVPVQGLENRYMCKDGSFRWLCWQSITEPGSRTVFCVARDVTERRRLEHEQMQRAKLEAAGVLSGGIAHDFNNLLAGIALNLDIVALAGPTTPAQAHQLREAVDGIWAAKSLTDRLLMLTGRGEARREACDLGKILEGAVELALGESKLHYECRVAPDLWPVEVNAEQIGEVVRGLLLNAREATPPGGSVVLEAENVALPTLPNVDALVGDCVVFRVIDTGSGIPPDVLPKVFDPYFSTKERATQRGMGLGLTTCRIFLQEHGGTIAIDTGPGAGTTVTCHLPAARSSVEAASGRARRRLTTAE